jgi:GNAT superfamily N-acetyltransferase
MIAEPRPTIVVEKSPSAADLRVLEEGLSEQAARHEVPRDYRLLTVLLRDSREKVIGGAHGSTVWKWLHIKTLWVAEEWRGKGYGRALVQAAEREAARRGCLYSHLDTVSYQAPDFYERLGYQAYAVLDDYPRGFQRIFFKKAPLSMSASKEG